MQLWDSEDMVSIRKNLVNGTVSHTACSACYDRYFSTDHDILGMGKTLPIRSLNMSEDYRKYYNYANSSYIRGDIVLDYTPPEIYVFTSERCNLRCRMCTQNKSDERVFPVDNVKTILKKNGWNHIDRFGFIGGEPLLTSDGMQLLDFVANEKLNGTCIYITTNGMLLRQRIETLKMIENLFLTISVDGVRNVYEGIRINAKWEKLVDNLMLLKKIKESERPNWKINFNSIVMKSTIAHLLDLLKLGETIGATVFFNVINEAEDENIFTRPWLLDELPNWQQHIDTTLEYADRIGAHKAYDSLKVIKKRIISVRENCKPPPFIYRSKKIFKKLQKTILRR